jgi:SCY1-like protein 1
MNFISLFTTNKQKNLPLKRGQISRFLPYSFLFKVIKGFMDKLEQVSENAELKEEMEKEVTSTNSQVLTQAASWASWAVGATVAKFYKSANKPPESAIKEGETSGSTAKSDNPEVKNSVKSPRAPAASQKSQQSNQDLISLGKLVQF